VGLKDAIIDGLEQFLRQLFSPITGVIERYANDLIRTLVETPHPDVVFAKPSNDPWPELHEYYWGSIIPLALLLWGLMIGVVILLESMSYLFSNYHRTKLKKRAVTGLLGILSWWWLAALSMQLMSGLTGFLVPDLSEISLFETLSFAAIGVLGIAMSLSIDLVLFVLLALIYFTRILVLYLFVLLMPLLIALWVPGVGPFSLASQFMKRMAGFYVPFLFMTVPVALLFRLGEILGSSVSLSMGGLGTWLTALVIPFAAILSPIVLFWQAGALFFVGDRMAHRTSRNRATSRVQSAKHHGSAATRGGKNFARGVRGDPAQTAGGQTVFGSGQSRSHAAGSRLNSMGTRLHGAYNSRRSGSTGGTTTPPSGGTQQSTRQSNPSTPERSPPVEAPALEASNDVSDTGDSFDNLRNRTDSAPALPPSSEDTVQHSTGAGEEIAQKSTSHSADTAQQSPDLREDVAQKSTNPDEATAQQPTDRTEATARRSTDRSDAATQQPTDRSDDTAQQSDDSDETQ